VTNLLHFGGTGSSAGGLRERKGAKGREEGGKIQMGGRRLASSGRTEKHAVLPTGDEGQACLRWGGQKKQFSFPNHKLTEPKKKMLEKSILGAETFFS